MFGNTKKAVLLSLFARLTTAQSSLGYYDSSEIVPMSEYNYDYRTLDCAQCFQAKGKMCHDKDYASMIKVTGSSNLAHGVCCKPDYNGEHCNNDGDHVCSAPSEITDSASKYAAILTPQNRNMQMYAFCPGIN